MDAANLIIGAVMLLGGALGVGYFLLALLITPQPRAEAEVVQPYPSLDRFIMPVLIPVGVALAVAAIIALTSQILLSVKESVATPIALGIALLILLGCTVIATMRRPPRGMIYTAIGLPVFALLIAGGIATSHRQSEGKTTEAKAPQLQTAPTETTTDNKFSTVSISVPAGQPVTLTVDNMGLATHNWHVLDTKDDAGKDIKTELTDPGKTSNVSFTISKAGSYKFQCDVHPNEMIGTLVVAEAGAGSASTGGATAPAGTGATSAGGTPAPAGSIPEVTTDNKFSSTALTVKAGEKSTVFVQNNGTATHNWHVTNVKDDSGTDIKTELLDAGKSASASFTISKPGKYKFQCDVHPKEMIGELTVQ